MYMKKILSLAGTFTLPTFAFAATFNSIAAQVQDLLNLLIPILITLAVIYFFWGLANYILKSGTEEKENGREIMIWGIVALFVMVSIWGLVGLIGSTFGIQQGGSGAGFIPTVR